MTNKRNWTDKEIKDLLTSKNWSNAEIQNIKDAQKYSLDYIPGKQYSKKSKKASDRFATKLVDGLNNTTV